MCVHACMCMSTCAYAHVLVYMIYMHDKLDPEARWRKGEAEAREGIPALGLAAHQVRPQSL